MEISFAYYYDGTTTIGCEEIHNFIISVEQFVFMGEHEKYRGFLLLLFVLFVFFISGL